MKNIKKAISFILILSLFTGFVPLSTLADEGEQSAPPSPITTVLEEAADIDSDIDIDAAGEMYTRAEQEFKQEFERELEQEEKISLKKPEKSVTITQNFNLEDYLYGHSTYYNELKKAGRLDLIQNRIEDTAAEIEVVEPEKIPEIEEPLLEKPTLEEPVVEEPVEKPVAEEPAAEEPAVEEPVVEEPMVEEPMVEDPVIEEPVVEEPMVEDPVIEEPVVEEPMVEEPVIEEPVVEEPVVEEPVIEEPVVEEPVVEEPMLEEPGIEEPFIDEAALDKQVIDEQFLRDTLGEEFIEAALSSASTREYYNTLVGPSAMNNLSNTQYSAWQNMEEIISPETGDLTLKLTDISLPGRNGLDLDIARIYQSNQSHFGDKKISGDLTYSYEDYSTYSVNRYNLGMGWMFNFPSVQIEQEGSTKELYYHLGDGTVYHVNFTSSTSDSNLEKYFKKDAVFNNDSSYSNGQVDSAYVFTTADQTKRYFAADGRLLGIVDRFGNEIKFEHIEKPVSNRSPNNDFENPENEEVWTTNSYYSYDTGFGKDDSTSYKFYRASATTQSGLSKYIEALPNTKYYLGGYINDQLTAGTASLTWREYDQNYSLIRQGALNSATIKDDWQHVEQYFTTHSNTRYIRIEFKNTSAQGNSWVDKVVFDRAWPLISKITDSIGREIDFSYTDTLYEEYPDEKVTITVNDPVDSDNLILTYEKIYWNFNFTWRFTDEDNWTEQRKCPGLWLFSNGVESQYYCSDSYPSGAGDYEYYSFWEKTQSSYSGWTCAPLLHQLDMRNSTIFYDYAPKTNHLGTDGFIQTHRIVERYERFCTSGGWSTEQQNRQQYSYSGVSGSKTFDNESGYPHTSISPTSTSFYFTCTMVQDNGLQTEQKFRGSSIGLRKYSDRSILASGEEKAVYYDSYDSSYPNQPTVIRTADITPGAGTQILYQGYTYNTWGGLATEIRPLTQAQWNNAATKQKNTISYTYDATYKFLDSKSYYQDENTQLSMSHDYDSMGRLISSTNEKGETTEFFYEDSSHPGNLTETSIDLPGGESSIVAYDYSDSSNTYAYPTAVTQYYNRNGSPASSTTVNQYEYLFGNVISKEDGEGNQTAYEYDAIGRLVKVTHPPSSGATGPYTLEDRYVYRQSLYPAELNGRRAFYVYYYRSKIVGGNPSTIERQYTYYDDHGNLLLSKRWYFETYSYMVDQYTLNDYGQYTSHQDARGNTTSWETDPWNRLLSITDPQGSRQLYEYNNYYRTVSSHFVPQDTGIPENHHQEAFDQWGRVISQKGFPSGISQAAIEQTYQYDLVGNLTETTDGRGNTTIYRYDSLNRLVGVTDALEQDTDYEYNRLGQLAQVSQYEDQQEFITAKEYDERGLVTQHTAPRGEKTRYTYNANGLPVEIINPSGKTTTLDYDANNRLSHIAVEDQQIDYYYHHLGGVEKYDVSGAGEDLWYNYYSTGLTSQRKVGSFETDFSYDFLGNRTQISDPFGLAVSYQYDSLNRISNIQVDGKTFGYEYCADGMIKAVNYPNGLRTEYAYDNMNRLTSLVNKRGGATLSQFGYAYDGNSNIVSVNANGQTTTYQYDALNRLTGISRPGGETITYQYDSRGNRTELTGIDAGRDNFTPGRFTYNSWDEMSSFSPTEGGATTYQYDPEGVRTQKTTLQASIRYHCDDNGLVIAESNGTSQVTAQNIWGHKPLARKVGGSYYYYLYNGHGDVIALTDESGNIVNAYEYDEWGNILSETEQIDNPIRYAGEYYDEESGLYYLRARYYDPVLGRFISNDPYEGDITDPLSRNAYIYCANNPLIYVDPEGKFLVALGYFAAAVAGAVAVTGATAKVADTISGTNSSGKVYSDTKTYLSSSEAQKAYIATGAAVATTGMARFSFSGGVAYLEQMVQRFQNLPVIKTIQKEVISIGYKNLDKIIVAQQTVDDLIKPGVPQSILGKGKVVYDAIKPAVNYAKENTPKVINRAKQSYVQVKTTVEKQLNNAQVFIQQKSEQIKASVNNAAESVKQGFQNARQSASNWIKSLW